jgi:adenylate kinase
LFVILLGPPGSGKGTQAAVIAERLGVAHIASGDLFRDNIRRETELGRKAKPYYDQGLLVPDELTIGMILERLEEPDCRKGCILDGYPRNLDQAKALDAALAERGQAVDRVLYVDVPDDELVSRLSGRWACPQCGQVYHERFSPPKEAGVCDRCGTKLQQREDDRPETVRRRLEVQRPPADLLEHYRAARKLSEVDGRGEVESVTGRLLNALEMAHPKAGTASP